MSGVEGGSVPPPDGLESQSASALAVPVVPVVPVVPMVRASQPPAEAAVRWRIGADVIDNLLAYGLYLVLCLVLHWRVANLGHLLVLLVLDVLYHFVLESRDGQTETDALACRH